MFKNVDLVLPARKILFIKGASGSGKSSLLRIIGKLELPDSGQIHCMKTHATIEEYRQNVSLLSQTPVFWGKTVRSHLQDILTYKANQSIAYNETYILHLLDQFGFDNKILDQRPSKLSGGESQVIALIRAIILQPMALLLDEPETALDSNRSALFRDFVVKWVESANHTRGLAWITHQNHNIRNSELISLGSFQEGHL